MINSQYESNYNKNINFYKSTYLFRSPLETSNDGIFDFAQILDGPGAIYKQVGSVDVGSESPNLTGFIDVPLVFIGQVTSTNL